LRQELLGIIKQVFCSLVALTVLEKLFSLPVRKIFGISEPREQVLKRTPQGTFLQKKSFLGVIVSEKIFKENLTPDAYADASKRP
jgi:hypothetical protein